MIAAGVFIGGLAVIFWRQVLTLLGLLAAGLVVIIAIIWIKEKPKPNIDSTEIVVPDRLPPEFLSTIRLDDDDRLHVSGFVDADSLINITESIHGGIRSIEIESINGDAESLINFSKLVEAYKKPILVRGVCPLQCAVVAFAGRAVTFEENTNNPLGETGETPIYEGEKNQMLGRLAALGVKEADIKAAGQPNFDMSRLRK